MNPTEHITIPDYTSSDPPTVINENFWPSYGMTWSSNVSFNETGQPPVLLPIEVVAGAFSSNYSSVEPEIISNMDIPLDLEVPEISMIQMVTMPNLNQFLSTLTQQRDIGLRTLRDIQYLANAYLAGKVEILPNGAFQWLPADSYRNGQGRRYSRLCSVLRQMCYMLLNNPSLPEAQTTAIQQFIVDKYKPKATSVRTSIQPITYLTKQYEITPAMLDLWTSTTAWAAALTHRAATISQDKMLQLWWNIFTITNGAKIYERTASVAGTRFEGVMPNNGIYVSQISKIEVLTQTRMSNITSIALPIFMLYWAYLGDDATEVEVESTSPSAE